MPTPFPTPIAFITRLFDSLSSIPVPSSSPLSTNILTNASPALKNVFLTLHCLFPNDFLPALDLLDRSLITRFVLATPPSTRHVVPKNVVYYVRSSQPTRPSRHVSSSAFGGHSYEVRLTAWNCTCPGFTFAALETEAENSVLNEDEVGYGAWLEEGRRWRFGGLALGEGGRLCKHLLACVLVERCRLFTGLVEERVVSREEAAGWAAGWGD